MKLRGQARTLGEPGTMEVIYRRGRWYASVTVVCEPKRMGGEELVGIDWGTRAMMTSVSSRGEVKGVKNPRFLRKELGRLKFLHKEVSRKKRGSKNREKAKRHVAKLHEKIANQRRDFLHQLSAKIVSCSKLIATEELNVKGMTSGGGAYKKGLNREILSTSPALFFQMLRYKAQEAGVEYVEVPTREIKPSQTCSDCGDQEKKSLNDRIHHCSVCGLILDRDVNAAQVMLNYALSHKVSSQELAWCGGKTAVFPVKHETPPISALAL